MHRICAFFNEAQFSGAAGELKTDSRIMRSGLTNEVSNYRDTLCYRNRLSPANALKTGIGKFTDGVSVNTLDIHQNSIFR
jgi:hypothetical protein